MLSPSHFGSPYCGCGVRIVQSICTNFIELHGVIIVKQNCYRRGGGEENIASVKEEVKK